MFNRRTIFAAVLLPASLLIGCSSGNSSNSSSSAKPADTPAATQPAIPIPPDSPFAKVKKGMSMEGVEVTVGPPTSRRAYATGKAWIPFHQYAGDNSRVTFYYKGIGTITFSKDSAFTSGYSVMEDGVNYDPSEPGYPQ